MMGYSHALTGVMVGAVIVELSPAPWPVDTLALLACGGAALLPDIDHPGATVARSLGPITGLLSRAINHLALWIYHATRMPGDNPDRRDGHRLITHTPVGAVSFGLLVAIACVSSSVAAGATLGLVIGLLGAGMRRTLRVLTRKLLGIRQGAGLLLFAVSGVSGYLVSERYPGWWWMYGVAVALGCQIHREGDWCTNSGVPRRLWPKVKNGRRWDKSRTPATFETGKETEVMVVQKLLLAGAVLSLAWCTGTLGVAIDAVAYMVAHRSSAAGAP